MIIVVQLSHVCQCCSLCICVLYANIYIVPALHKDPDIKVFNNFSQTQFTLIEHDTVHNGSWNTNELNQDDFDETGEIKFYIENWLFQTIQGVTRWLPRNELIRPTQRLWFKLLRNDSKNGTFSFKQTTRSPAKLRFIISLVALKKVTKNLEILYTSSLLSFVPNLSSGSGIDAIKEVCQVWRNKTVDVVNPNDLKSCPCTLESARVDPNLAVDFTCSATERDCHENVRAHRCFLMNLNKMYVSITSLFLCYF